MLSGEVGAGAFEWNGERRGAGRHATQLGKAMVKDLDPLPVRMRTPSQFILGMLAFLIVVGLFGYALIDQIREAFFSNPFINGTILGVLAVGILISFSQILGLSPAVRWLNGVRRADMGVLVQSDQPPPLMASLSMMVDRDWGQVSFAALAMRSILDSVGGRLEEGRELMRYLVGLLVFLGLLGTFWGLLQTIAAVGDTVGALNPDSNGTEDVFGQLVAGIQAPLSGMATAFSSSLFGLASSLVLGFLDVQSSRAQNHFYNDLEEWLSEATEISARVQPRGDARYSIEEGFTPSAASYQALETSMEGLRQDVRHLSETLKQLAADADQSRDTRK